MKKNNSKNINIYKNNIYNKELNILKETKKLENKYLKNNDSIELFGIPGCGKSYYANNITPEHMNLNKKYVYSNNRIIRNLKKLILISSEMFCCIKKYITASKLLSKLSFSSKSKKTKMKIYLMSTIALTNKSKKKLKEKNKVILEEGLLQVLWGICYNSDADDKFIDKYIDFFSNDFQDKIIVLNTDINEITKRLELRNNNGGSELEHDIKNKKNLIIKANDIKNKIQSAILKKFKNKVIIEVN